MLGFCPLPYPDELLYSILARYDRLVGYRSQRATIRDLFATQTRTAIIMFPSSLDLLVEHLPGCPELLALTLIDNHTVLPFFRPFLPPERAQQIVRDMCGTHGAVDQRSGSMASRVQNPTVMRVCVECARSEKGHLGECYWHRLHQVSGVDVCPEHGVYLSDTTIAMGGHRARLAFHGVPDEVIYFPTRQVEREREGHALLRLAQDASWLLTHRELGPGLDAIRHRYLRLLHRRGYASYRGRVCVADLCEAVRQRFGDQLLGRLQSPLEPAEASWLSRLVRTPRGAQHPVRHLLLMQFLEVTASDFFSWDPEPLFGYGPWPCLNKVCPAYHQPVISSCDVTHNRRSKRTVGTFTCTCGFAYTRTGRDPFKRSRIKQFGRIWETQLKELATQGTGLRQLARTMGVDTRTVQYHLARFCVDSEGGFEESRHSSTTEIKRRHRATWLTFRRQHPDASSSQLRKSQPSAYNWLRRHDLDWLDENSPPRLRPAIGRIQVDWADRDEQLAAAVSAVAQSQLAGEGLPVRITATGLVRRANCAGVVFGHRDRLPKTCAVLDRFHEDREAFALRRIRWVLRDLRARRKSEPVWRVIRRARLRSDVLQMPLVIALLKNEVPEFIEEGFAWGDFARQ